MRIIFKKVELYFDTYQIRICHIKSNDIFSFHKNIFNKFLTRLILSEN